MRHRYILVILTIFCFASRLSAQQVFTVRGVTSKNLSGLRIAQVIVTNLKTKDIMESDDVGWFSIKASIGDTLQFTKLNFVTQKIAIVNTGDIPVFMEPLIILDQVTVKGQTKKQELSDVMADYRRQGTYYDGKPSALSFLSSPITGLYELFGATPGRARRFKANSKAELEYAEVQRRYNIALVKRVTNTTDTIAKKFMEYYTPSYEDLKEWNDYELVKHIHLNYDFYDKTKDKESLRQSVLPPLVKPADKKVEKVDLSKDQ
jgi:hypothetical protein